MFYSVYVCVAKLLNDRYFGSFDSAQQADLSELFSYSSTQELLSSELVNKFRYLCLYYSHTLSSDHVELCSSVGRRSTA